ncbi:MAG: lipoyl(octanoyl) transferase LipB [Deltaproteobacteria bacterium]|nr:lipoyl(octanoyl) transferase LipB [Deltaproteobacteria bacterium]
MEQQSTFSKSRGRSPKILTVFQKASKIRGNVPCLDLGQSDYASVHQLQLQIVSDIALNNRSELIIITEHFPVYTCGRSTKPHERPLGSSIPVVDIERGGGLTYHGPGQIVGYPILNLGKRKMSIPQYLRKLENILISVLADYGVTAHYREECRAGVWVGPEGGGGKKLISMGIAVRRWVAFHGFALNVDCDLAPFKNAQPCGMAGDNITSLKELGHAVCKVDLKKNIIEKLNYAFF